MNKTIEDQNFSKEYFKFRKNNDLKRQKSFFKESQFIKSLFDKNIKDLKILDVGCSTGEFLNYLFNFKINTNSDNLFGIEPSSYAANLATKESINIIDDNDKVQFFDLIIYRGTIQYIPDPFISLKKSYISLKPHGKIVFLATPNTRSLYYFLFKTLPFLEDPFMYWIPSDQNLKLFLNNLGFKKIEIFYPYLDTPYSNPLIDFFRFICKLITGKGKFPFPGNLIWISAEK